MASKKKPAETARVTVRAKHEYTGDDTRGMFIGAGDIVKIAYNLDVLGSDLVIDREAAIEMYAQMAASRMRKLLDPIEVRR